MASTWTALADKAALDVITPTIWNAILGDEGNLQYLYDGRVAKDKASQVFTTNTTFADLTASSGTFSFTIAANELWVVRFHLPVSFGGTGGVKLQLTGPSAPTLVRMDAWGEEVKRTEADVTTPSDTYRQFHSAYGSATAFSSSFVAKNSGGTEAVGSGGGVAAIVACTIHGGGIIRNGANAGTVTLQGAQNSSNSTTTFAAGGMFHAERIG